MSWSDFLKSFFGNGSSRKERDWRDVFSKDGESKENSAFSKFRDGLHRQLEDLFKKFGYSNFPPALEPPDSSVTPRINEEDILKDIEPFLNKEIESFMKREFEYFSPPSGKQWDFHKHFEFGKSFGPNWGNIQPKEWKGFEDGDIDGKIDDKEVSKMFERLHKNPGLDKPKMFNEHKSVSISTFRSADGKIEQKKTIKDSSGREETTVTRTVGDKIHSVTTKIDEKGEQEKVETLKNMDEKDLSSFEEAWKSGTRLKQESLLPPPSNSTGDKSDDEIFSKIFKMSWK
ncbi:hypothetical protein ScPMuIL_018715 [Solemya velum]